MYALLIGIQTLMRQVHAGATRVPRSRLLYLRRRRASRRGRFVNHHVQFPATTTLKVLFNAPFYGLAIESLVQHIVPDESMGEAPELPRFELQRSEGSTADVDYWTSKDVRETKKSHVN